MSRRTPAVPSAAPGQRQVFGVVPRAVHGWLKEGRTGTAVEIAAAVGHRPNSVRVALMRLRSAGYAQVVDLRPVVRRGHVLPGTVVYVYAVGQGGPWLWCPRAHPAGLLDKALRSRTPLERAWL